VFSGGYAIYDMQQEIQFQMDQGYIYSEVFYDMSEFIPKCYRLYDKEDFNDFISSDLNGQWIEKNPVHKTKLQVIQDMEIYKENSLRVNKM